MLVVICWAAAAAAALAVRPSLRVPLPTDRAGRFRAARLALSSEQFTEQQERETQHSRLLELLRVRAAASRVTRTLRDHL